MFLKRWHGAPKPGMISPEPEGPHKVQSYPHTAAHEPAVPILHGGAITLATG